MAHFPPNDVDGLAERPLKRFPELAALRIRDEYRLQHFDIQGDCLAALSSAAGRLAQRCHGRRRGCSDRKVALVEQAALVGGAGINTGTIPSKTCAKRR